MVTVASLAAVRVPSSASSTRTWRPGSTATVGSGSVAAGALPPPRSQAASSSASATADGSTSRKLKAIEPPQRGDGAGLEVE